MAIVTWIIIFISDLLLLVLLMHDWFQYSDNIVLTRDMTKNILYILLLPVGISAMIASISFKNGENKVATTGKNISGNNFSVNEVLEFFKRNSSDGLASLKNAACAGVAVAVLILVITCVSAGIIFGGAGIVCGGNNVFTETIINSPNYPYSYPSNKDCERIIRFPENQTITLEFLEFDLEHEHDCRNDWLEVRDGDDKRSSIIGKRMCGYLSPSPITSRRNELLIRFHSDNATESKGYNIKVWNTEHWIRKEQDNYCPWISMSTEKDNVYKCNNGFSCNGLTDGFDCCKIHGGRELCPQNFPVMCDSRICANGTDYCCESTEFYCGRLYNATRRPCKIAKQSSHCLWAYKTTTQNNVFQCKDGYSCNIYSKGFDCCTDHGGRELCPKNWPVMCDSTKCANGTDYCCESEEFYCNQLYNATARSCRFDEQDSCKFVNEHETGLEKQLIGNTDTLKECVALVGQKVPSAIGATFGTSIGCCHRACYAEISSEQRTIKNNILQTPGTNQKDIFKTCSFKGVEQCPNGCKTMKKSEAIKKFGDDLDPHIYGYEFDKPCKFPFRINHTLFYGCVLSSEHDSVGPWCFTETTDLIGYTHSPVKYKWGLCSNDCPAEDCPSCEDTFLYEGKSYDNCTNIGWPDGNTDHFGKSEWCYTDNQRYIWKFCSKKCHPQNRPTTSTCNAFLNISMHINNKNSYFPTNNHYQEDHEKKNLIMYRQYENVTSNCYPKEWCPIQLDVVETAICLNNCI